MKLSKVSSSLAMPSSILFNLSPVLGMTALSESNHWWKRWKTLSIPDEEATSIILVVLQLKMLVEEETEVGLFIDENDRHFTLFGNDLLHRL